MVKNKYYLYFFCCIAKRDEYTAKRLELLAERFEQFRPERGYTNYEQFAFDNELPRAGCTTKIPFWEINHEVVERE